MSKYPDPVIFIPGIMGSGLRDEYPVGPETVWSPFKLFIKAFDRIILHPDNTNYELKEPARVVRDQVFDLVYGEIIEEMRHNLSPEADQPVPVFPFAYDWRLPLPVVQRQLDDFITETVERTALMKHYHADGYTKDSGRVHLVAHSMGGLVVAGYMAAQDARRVNKIATIAAPLRGSLEAAAKTSTGVGNLGMSPGSSREREAARLTPALYFLLPSFEGAVTADGGMIADLFNPLAWQPGILRTLASFIRINGLDPENAEAKALTLLTDLLGNARTHRNALEALTLDNPKRWLCIAGVHTETRTAMTISPDADNAPRFEFEEEVDAWDDSDPARKVRTGDSTVPYLGARCSFIPEEQVVCVTPDDFSFWELKDRALEAVGFHSNLPNMNLVQRLVVSHLKGTAEGDIWGRRPPGIAEDAWDPPIPGLRQEE